MDRDDKYQDILWHLGMFDIYLQAKGSLHLLIPEFTLKAKVATAKLAYFKAQE